MNGINSLVIEGNLVRDAVIKETSSGNVVSNFSIAVNRSVKTPSLQNIREKQHLTKYIQLYILKLVKNM